jgi:DNA-binding transcriptional LysR family regulator
MVGSVHTPLELRLLRYFVAVAEELHFGRAAARLHIAQPSLSVQIRKLEHGIGTPLLLRTSRHVELTADRAAELTRAAAQGARGSLVVGFQANAAAELTPKILSAFQVRHPGVQVEMRSHDFSDPYVGLATGSSDVAFVRPPLLMQDWLALETLFVEPRVLVVSSDCSLAQFDEVTLEQLADRPFVARRAPDYWRDFWLAADARDGRPVRLGAEVTTVDECFEAILARRGMAFTQASTQRFYDRPGLAFIPVRELSASPLSIAWRTDMDAPVVSRFVETARAAAAWPSVPGGLISSGMGALSS